MRMPLNCHRHFLRCRRGSPIARAEQWVAKMFAEREHNFGTVARGADTVYRFPVKNIYKQDIELVSVRSSCGCTTPSIEKQILKTGESATSSPRFNTRTFTGMHGATLTVEVAMERQRHQAPRRDAAARQRQHPRRRRVQAGRDPIRHRRAGHAVEQEVEVTYAGRPDWKIVDVRGASDDLEVELTQKQRVLGPRRPTSLLVRLKDSASAGYFNEQLMLVTNDEQNPRIPIHVAGRIVPQISVAPESVLLGDVALANQVSKKVIVRGKKPFRIVSVKCDEDSFQFKVDDRAKRAARRGNRLRRQERTSAT